MKKSTTDKFQSPDRRRSIILNTLIVVAVLWYPISFFVNPGWFTLAIMVDPMRLLGALIPLVAIKFANALRPKGESLPKGLFWMEIAFCILWILLWCFAVNGGDTEESIHSILSRVFGGIWNESVIVDLSGPLFGITAAILAALAIAMAIYNRPNTGAVWGRRLLIANFAYLVISTSVDPIFASFGVYINPTWSLFYDSMAIVVGVLGALNIVYVLHYFRTAKNKSKKAWVFGILAILASLLYVWSFGVWFMFLINKPIFL